MSGIHEILKKYYGYDSFRPGQEEIISHILDGKDVAAIMPTGAGKSVCYQVPALAMKGITLVISPLISLMQDQVRTLLSVGVRAAYLNSSLTPRQFQLALDNAKRGVYKIIYVAPERLETENFLDFACNADISILAVDEAHCVSQWGQDFRPSYLKIGEFVKKLPKRPVVAAFTATATSKVRVDIINKLGLNKPVTYISSFDRENLYFGIHKPENKLDYIVEYLNNHHEESGIIYCLTRKDTEAVAKYIEDAGHTVMPYHAGLSDERRKKAQEDFIYDRIKIIVATNAFGMGIDKPNVRYVIHYSMPGRMEDYYQQAGRAGRDGEPSECILLYAPRDVRLNQFMITRTPDDDPLTPAQREAYIKTEEECLRQMTFYSTSQGTCLRKRILNYFGENYGQKCKNCSCCLDDIEERSFGISSSVSTMIIDEALFNRLKDKVRILALFGGVPVFTIASDAMLRELSAVKPRTTAQLRHISGFGEEKIKRYGNEFINIINEYENEAEF